MTTAADEKPAAEQPAVGKSAPKKLRVWPALVAVGLQWLAWIVLPIVAPDARIYGMVGGILGGALVVIIWWLFFSRAAWIERISALVLIVAAMFATAPFIHKSIAGGAMGMLFVILAIPILCLALVTWAVGTRRFGTGVRRASLVGTIVLACAGLTLIRTGGMSGEGSSDLHWRWTPTPEERLLSAAANEPVSSSPTPEATSRAAATPSTAPAAAAEWPGFRGPARDGIVRGIQIATDWVKSPPVELWRRLVGPGWSSFAVRGDRFYTQEQRGSDEVVACYNMATGKPVWQHKDPARFWESNAGAGPRATPTLAGDRVYTFGATGIVNALDASGGRLIWSHNAAADTGEKVPAWGFSASPLVVDDAVIIATGGRMVAYDLAKGDRRWLGPEGHGGYSSPHLTTIGGRKQIVLLNPAGATSVAPAGGKLLWKCTWPSDGIVQPALTPEGDILLGSGSGMSGATGVLRISVWRESEKWIVQERWTSIGLKPYFSDSVVHHGHAFGFDGGMLSCIDLAEGKRKWKGGRYGHGQLILLPEQNLLLVLSEEGDLALVAAKPERFSEVARARAISGKTWNHPVLVGDVLLARNGEEMAAFRLCRSEH
jgi:outer membrane protein assembly factor BamB